MLRNPFISRLERCFKVGSSRRFIITGPTKTGTKSIPSAKGSSKNEKSSGSPFDSSFTFQLFLIVGAMGAGYTLGKTTILTSPPATLFPEGSITPAQVLKDFEKEDKERENKQYDMFKRCALRILEQKGIDVDVKYGKNEALYNEDYCSKDIAEIMNVADGMTDVFFGKDPAEWKDKSFTWYPETTEDVSLIMKNCQEFKVPVYTQSFKANSNDLTFMIDFSHFKHQSSTDKLVATFNIQDEELKNHLSVSDYLTRNLSATDLFFISCGLKLPRNNNKLISNCFDINVIDEIECVLPDGNITMASNDPNDASNGIFQTLSRFQDELCIVTKVMIEKGKIETYKESHNLIVIGANDLEKLNGILKDIKLSPEISLVDNNGCNEISQRYGNYSTFAAFKIDDKSIAKLNKKFLHGEEVPNEYKIERIPLSNLRSRNQIRPLSHKENELKRVVLVKEDIKNSFFKTYYVSDSSDEDVDDINTSLLRRIKLAVDPARVLNPGVGVTLKPN